MKVMTSARWLLAVVVFLTLGLGSTWYVSAEVLKKAQFEESTIADVMPNSVGEASPETCEHCEGASKMAPSACSVVCLGVLGLEASEAEMALLLGEVPSLHVVDHLHGSRAAPDPFPPPILAIA